MLVIRRKSLFSADVRLVLTKKCLHFLIISLISCLKFCVFLVAIRSFIFLYVLSFSRRSFSFLFVCTCLNYNIICRKWLCKCYFFQAFCVSLGRVASLAVSNEAVIKPFAEIRIISLVDFYYKICNIFFPNFGGNF